MRKSSGKAAARGACLRFTNLILALSLLAFLLSRALPSQRLIDSSEMKRDLMIFSTRAARAVIEDHSHSETLHRPSILEQGSLGFSKGLKIYVYDLPASFNVDWLKDKRCSSHLFAAEVAIHQNLLRSPVRTVNASEADFFFVPVYVSCNFTGKSGFPTLSRAPEVLRSAVELVSGSMPYWGSHGGRDHIFVATHDYGACFHAMEDIAMTMGIPEFLRNSIILQTFGQRNKHPCQRVDHIQIPPYVTPYKKLPDFNAHKRKIFAFFRGKMEIHPKNVSGHMYSRGVRTVIWKKFSHDRRFFIKRKRSDNYREEMERSIFCLCPLGWAPWSPRIVEAVMAGCVPVIIADQIQLPYSHVVDWKKISVAVPEREVHRLGRILSRVAATNLTSIQRNLWREEVRGALVFEQPMARGDATWQVLELLSRRKKSAGGGDDWRRRGDGGGVALS